MNDDQPAGSPPAGLNQAAIDWAWAQSITNNPGARIALLCLARRVDESWECTASQEEVAMDAMVPARSMRRYLDQLEEGGWITRQRRMSDTGSRLPDGYRLNPGETLPAKLDGRQVRGVDPYRPNWPVANLATGSDQQESLSANLAGSAPLEANMASGEPAKPQVGASGQIGLAIGVSSSSSTEEEQNLSTTKGGAGGKKSRPADEEHPRFAEWYAAYPLHDKRPQAVKAFNKAVAKVGDPQILIDGAKRYAEHDPRVKRGYIKGPSVWLNNDCWDDEIPPEPRSGPDQPGSAYNGSGSQVPPRGQPRQNPFRNKRRSA